MTCASCVGGDRAAPDGGNGEMGAVIDLAHAVQLELAYQVADEALQLLGGYGLSREYPMEKLFRDARAALIEDGENHLLNMKFGYLTSLLYRSGRLGS